MTDIKICCMESEDEIQLALRYGIRNLGFVSEMPTPVGVIPESLIRDLVQMVPSGVRTFLLTSEYDVSRIVAQQNFTRVNTLQLISRLMEDALVELRERLPGVSLVQVVHVNGIKAVEEARKVTPYVDGLLLDSGNPDKPEEGLGGTGRIHNWELSAEIVKLVEKPVFLAGGLRSDNVAEAISRVHPYGVDVCSGLRPDGKLSESMLAKFIRAVHTGVAN
ncbi:MAG: phosphoribosylanthranilate isomerase [Dehalococcoidales bacterium]|nr:MAG: phosphoribosylanthranilate isomerase [Dehalococcoidales bacterium]